jgi:Bacterial DNA-binding protein
MTLAIRHLKEGARVRLIRVGTLHVQRPLPQRGLNLQTGEVIEIKGTGEIVFRPAKELVKASQSGVGLGDLGPTADARWLLKVAKEVAKSSLAKGRMYLIYSIFCRKIGVASRRGFEPLLAP